MNIFQLLITRVDARGRAVASGQSITGVWFGLDESVTLVSIPSFEWTISQRSVEDFGFGARTAGCFRQHLSEEG